MPTKNIKDVRGYIDVAYLFIDEADHFDKSIQEELEPAITAYEEKSKGKTIMASTPNRPDGLFERIEKDPNSKYKKLFLGYELGLGKIYDPEYIAQKKLEPEFEREYNLKYLGKVGNVFSPSQIDKTIQLGEQYKGLEVNDYTLHSVGVDFGFGSSRTAIVLSEFLKEEHKIRVLSAEEYSNANPQDIVDISQSFNDSSNVETAFNDSNLYVVWQEGVSGNQEIFMRNSSNGGVTFGQPINISKSRGTSECPSISISINKLHIVWEDDTLGNHEIYYKSIYGNYLANSAS